VFGFGRSSTSSNALTRTVEPACTVNVEKLWKLKSVNAVKCLWLLIIRMGYARHSHFCIQFILVVLHYYCLYCLNICLVVLAHESKFIDMISSTWFESGDINANPHISIENAIQIPVTIYRVLRALNSFHVIHKHLIPYFITDYIINSPSLAKSRDIVDLHNFYPTHVITALLCCHNLLPYTQLCTLQLSESRCWA